MSVEYDIHIKQHNSLNNS